MPKPQIYRAGSLIYFKGDPAKEVFIVQKGRVNLKYQDIETNEDQNDLVQPGEFFGVKSALGRYPREENAVAVQDAAVMVFSVPEFEALAASNTRIIMKMLKVFSSQLRRVHKQVSSIMANEVKNPEEGLFDLGQFYLKNRKFNEAKYVLSSYLTYYPSGENAQKAASDLSTAERYTPKTRTVVPVPEAPVRTEARQSEASRAYYDAVNLISQQKFQQAYMSFKKIIDADSDAEYTAKSSYEMGRCFFLMGKFDECIKYYSSMITRYPKHPDLADCLFLIGQSWEKIKNREQAANFYKKVIAISDSEDNGARIKAKKALKALGV